jgi:hypothetical protein
MLRLPVVLLDVCVSFGEKSVFCCGVLCYVV